MDPARILPEKGERLSVILAKPAGARYPGTPGGNGEE